MDGEYKLMTYYLVKEIMGSKLVVVGRYKTKQAAINRMELQEQNKYSFETYSVCTESEYAELALKFI